MDDLDLLAPVVTKAALLTNSRSTEFKAQVFESRKHDGKREKVFQTNSKSETAKDNDGPEFDMKKARFEVINLGVSGFNKRNKKKALIEQAVKLGAIPPKKAYKNYKVLLAEKKRAKEMKTEQLRLRQLGKNKMGAVTVKHKQPKVRTNKKDLGQISANYGVVNPKIGKKKLK